jgi:hypothetical protein
MRTNRENERLSSSTNNRNWKKWGPYLSDRQWGTVREDYSPHGNTWSYVNTISPEAMPIVGRRRHRRFL